MFKCFRSEYRWSFSVGVFCSHFALAFHRSALNKKFIMSVLTLINRNSYSQSVGAKQF